MELICYVCNESTSDWHKNMVETKSIHSKTPIIEFINIFLGDYVSDRNINAESNCICTECLGRIYSYDWLCVEIKKQKNELRKLILKTESSFSDKLIENEFVYADSVELEQTDNNQDDCIDIKSDFMIVNDNLNGTEAIEIGPATFVKNEPFKDDQEIGRDDEDVGENDGTVVDSRPLTNIVQNIADTDHSGNNRLYLFDTKSQSSNRPKRQRMLPTKYSDVSPPRTDSTKISSRSIKGIKHTTTKYSPRTQKWPHSSKESGYQSKRPPAQVTQREAKVRCIFH